MPNSVGHARGEKQVLIIGRLRRKPGRTWVPLDAPNLPRLDLTHLPDWAGDFARALAAHTETPPELAAGMVLVTCATAAARRLRVMVKPGYFETCNLWVVVALPPGNRKSAVQGAATTPLDEWEKDQAIALRSEIDRARSEYKTMEARAKEIRTKAAREKDKSKAKELAREAADIEVDLPVILTPPLIWTSDVTPESLGTLLAEHGECMAWLSSEGGIFDLLQGRYSNGIPNLDLVLKAHSGDKERVDRGSRQPVHLRQPRLNIGLSPQPVVLRGLTAKPGFRGRGLLGRFLYLLPPSPLGYRNLKSNPIPKATSDAYAAGIRSMLDWEPATDEFGRNCLHQLELGVEAYTDWHDFALTIEKKMRPNQELEHFTDWAGKAPGAAARLAGVLHGIKHARGRPWEQTIAAETMQAAIEIMEVFIPHCLAALDMMGADPTIQVCRYLVKDFGTSRSPKSTRQRDSRYCPDR
ncbi:MAG: YfjI family protein, partial [Candidatus Sedimenticola endophacoides]